MNIPIKAFSAALASCFALAAIVATVGCGSGPLDTPGVGQDTGGTVAPPSSVTLPEPVVQYKFFEPSTEAELKGVYGEGEYRGLPIANYGYMIAKTNADFLPDAFGQQGLEIVGSMTVGGARYWYLHKEADLLETMKKARRAPGLMYIEPDMMQYAHAGFAYDKPDTHVDSGRQYGVLTTLTKKAWETYGFGPNRPVVVDTDTGIRWSHNDFKREDGTCVVTNAFTWFNADGSVMSGDPLRDPDPTDRMATNFSSGTTDESSQYYHGTHTAGTIGAVGNNGLGVAGVCWDIDLVSYKVLGGQGGSSWSVYGSLWHLARWRSELVVKTEGGAPEPRYPHTIPVNMSLGSAYCQQFPAEMIEIALERDIIICASAGNDRAGIPSWPGSYSGCIRVGGVNHLDRTDEVFAYSNWGPDLSVMAPSSSVYSLNGAGDTGYLEMDGTSMAAPHVTGLVGYMLTFAPDLKPDQIKTYLERNADPLEGQKGHTHRTGWGRINAYRTIGAVVADRAAGRTPPSDYVLTPVKILVRDAGGAPVNDAKVWLFNCNQGGTIQNFNSVQITGTSYSGVRDNPAAALEAGVTTFNLLRPGFYRAAASVELLDLDEMEYETLAASSSVFEVKPGGVAPVTLQLDRETLVIQTLASSNPSRANTATSIRFYNSETAGALITMYNGYWWNIAMVAPKKPATYWINVYPFNNPIYYGEYALWVGGGHKGSAPGQVSDPGPDGVASENAASRAAAQPINIADKKVIYGDLTTTGGHYYKFTVE